MKKAISIVIFVVLGFYMSAAAMGQEDRCQEGLKRLYPAMKDYAAAMGGLPEDLRDLYRSGFIEDPQALFFTDSAASRLAREWLEWATPSFQLLSWKLEGNILACQPDEEGFTHVLGADGGTRKVKVDLVRSYGKWEPIPFTTKVQDTQLDAPSARLGFTLREVPTDRERPALIVEAIIPGYVSAGGIPGLISDVRPGDRILDVNGHLVSTLKDLDEFLRVTSPMRPSMRIIRGDRILDRLALVPIPELGKPSTPRKTAGIAAIYLKPEGPGSLDVKVEDHAQGVEVTEVGKQSSTERAGIQPGDILESLEDRPITDPRQFSALTRSYQAGLTVRVNLLREGAKKTLDVTLDEMNKLDADRVRFAIHAGQLNLVEAFRYAYAVSPEKWPDVLSTGIERPGEVGTTAQTEEPSTSSAEVTEKPTTAQAAELSTSPDEVAEKSTTAASMKEIEPNNSPESANSAASTGKIEATILPQRDGDFYKLEVEHHGELQVQTLRVPANIEVVLRVWNDRNQAITGWMGPSHSQPGSPTRAVVDLPEKGTYYLEVRDSYDNARSDEPYELQLTFAPSVDRFEPDNTLETAVQVPATGNVLGTILPMGDADFYKLEVEQHGQLDVRTASVPAGIDVVLRVWNTKNQAIAGWIGPSPNQPGAPTHAVVDLPEKGVYYLEVRDGYNNARSIDPYELHLTFTASVDRFEPNNTLDAAAQVPATGNILGTILPVGEADFYKLEVAHHGELQVQSTTVPRNIDVVLRVWNDRKQDITGWMGPSPNQPGAPTRAVVDLPEKGTYYLEVRDGYNNARSVEPYELRLAFKQSSDRFEPDNSLEEAAQVPATGSVEGTILPLGDADFYKIEITHQGTLRIHTTKVPTNLDVVLRVWNDRKQAITGWMGPSPNQPGSPTRAVVDLPEKGIYYLEVRDGYNNARSVEPYELRLAFTPAGGSIRREEEKTESPDLTGKKITEIKGKVLKVSGAEINIGINWVLVPNVGEKVKIGSDESALSGMWEVTDVGEGFVVAQSGGKGPQPQQDQIAVILSHNPRTPSQFKSEQELLDAAKKGDLEGVQRAIHAGAGVNATGRNGSTALGWACSYGHVDVVRHLVGAGVEINREARNGQTPLNVAALRGQTEIVQILAEAGADVNARIRSTHAPVQYEGATPLLLASVNGQTDTVRTLIRFGADMGASNLRGETALFMAAMSGKAGTVRALIEAGADVNARTKIGATPLMYAAEAESAEPILVLINAGSDVNAKAARDAAGPMAGSTALMAAAVGGKSKAVRVLLLSGADASIKNAEGRTALDLATKSGNSDVVELLRDTREAARLARIDLDEYLMTAVKKGDAGTVRELVRFGVGVNVQDQDGVNALMRAIEHNFVQVVQTLVEAGADVNSEVEEKSKEWGGITPLLLAAWKGYEDIVKVIVQAGADVNKKWKGKDESGATGWTALMAAALNGHNEVVSQLLAAGADPRVSNSVGNRALDIARTKGNSEAISLLEEAAGRFE